MEAIVLLSQQKYASIHFYQIPEHNLPSDTHRLTVLRELTPSIRFGFPVVTQPLSACRSTLSTAGCPIVLSPSLAPALSA